MFIRHRLARVLVVGVGAASLSLTAVACGTDASDSAATPTTVQQVPDLVGTWSGNYEFPSKGKVIPTALNLVIERAEGANLFGYESFVDAKGETIRFDLVGTAEVNAATGRVDVAMATTGFYFDIDVVDADHLTARFVRTDDKPTTFLVNLTRKK